MQQHMRVWALLVLMQQQVSQAADILILYMCIQFRFMFQAWSLTVMP
jgi:hypothetical protein